MDARSSDGEHQQRRDYHHRENLKHNRVPRVRGRKPKGYTEEEMKKDGSPEAGLRLASGGQPTATGRRYDCPETYCHDEQRDKSHESDHHGCIPHRLEEKRGFAQRPEKVSRG